MSEPEKIERIGIYFTQSKTVPPVLTQLQKHYFSNAEYEVSEKSMEDLIQTTDPNQKYVLIFCVTDSESVNEFLNFTQVMRKEIKAKKVVPIILMKISNHKIEEILTKNGCAETLTFNINLKSLIYKVNRFLKLLALNKADVNDQFESIGKLSETDTPDSKNANVQKLSKTNEKNIGTTQVTFKDALDFEKDFWLFAKKNHAKKYLTNWLIELIGPSPAAGSWEKNPNQADSWTWKAKDPKSTFHTPEGSWVYTGNLPEYSWSLNRWAFVGTQAQLSFIQDGKITHTRFVTNSSQNLVIANNSKQAIASFEAIKNTYDRSHKFAQEKSEIPWGDNVNSEDLNPKDWNQGDLSQDKKSQKWNESDSEETADSNYLKSLLSNPEYKIHGTLNNKDVELIGFGTEKNAIFVGMGPETTKENESVTIKLMIASDTKPLTHVLSGKVSNIHSIETNKLIAKIEILPEALVKLEKVKKSFAEREKHASSFIMKAKGFESSNKAPTSDAKKNNELTEEFLRNNHILVIDSASGARISLTTALIKLGAISSQIKLVNSIEDANLEFKKGKYKLIFSDYMVGNKSGLGFIQEAKLSASQQGNNEVIAILVTSNASQSAVAKAAEGDIDNFVIKPYSFDNLKNVLNKTIYDKLYPNEYLKMIEEGKDLFLLQKFNEAKDHFLNAVKNDPAPALALSYLGQLSAIQKDHLSAEKYFTDGLTFNEIHFGCLMGLQELLYDQKRFHEAYDVAKELVKYFPANSKRLSNVLRAAIVTDRFQDIHDFYKVYLDIDERNDELVRYVCSAMLVAGKYFLKKKDTKGALELFDKAAITAAGKSNYLYYIIETLVDYKLQNECQPFLKRLYALSPIGQDYLAANFLASTLSLPTIDIVHQGRELLKKGVETPAVYDKLIHHSIKGGYREAADDLIQYAIQKWPEKKADFERFTKKAE